jgi:hypothetical protein
MGKKQALTTTTTDAAREGKEGKGAGGNRSAKKKLAAYTDAVNESQGAECDVGEGKELKGARGKQSTKKNPAAGASGTPQHQLTLEDKELVRLVGEIGHKWKGVFFLGVGGKGLDVCIYNVYTYGEITKHIFKQIMHVCVCMCMQIHTHTHMKV